MTKRCENYRKINGSKLLPKEKNITRISKLFKAISDPTRLKILYLLKKKELCVCEIMSGLKKNQPIVSHHLSILQNAGLIKNRKDGKWIYYKLSNPRIFDIIKIGEKNG